MGVLQFSLFDAILILIFFGGLWFIKILYPVSLLFLVLDHFYNFKNRKIINIFCFVFYGFLPTAVLVLLVFVSGNDFFIIEANHHFDLGILKQVLGFKVVQVGTMAISYFVSIFQFFRLKTVSKTIKIIGWGFMLLVWGLTLLVSLEFLGIEL